MAFPPVTPELEEVPELAPDWCAAWVIGRTFVEMAYVVVLRIVERAGQFVIEAAQLVIVAISVAYIVEVEKPTVLTLATSPESRTEVDRLAEEAVFSCPSVVEVETLPALEKCAVPLESETADPV